MCTPVLGLCGLAPGMSLQHRAAVPRLSRQDGQPVSALLGVLGGDVGAEAGCAAVTQA